VEFGSPVEIGGLHVAEGDLLCGDLHGLLSIPDAVADRVAPVAADLLARERPIIDLCESADFSIEKLRTLVKELS
jgi:regulator of RNase E activity RraA